MSADKIYHKLSYPKYSMILSHSVIGLLMWGKRFRFFVDHVGGVDIPVPHLGWEHRLHCPLEGSICLRVDHSSQREEGEET